MNVGDLVNAGGKSQGTVTALLDNDEVVVKWQIRTFTGRLTHHSAVYHASELRKVNRIERGEDNEPVRSVEAAGGAKSQLESY